MKDPIIKLSVNLELSLEDLAALPEQRFKDILDSMQRIAGVQTLRREIDAIRAEIEKAHSETMEALQRMEPSSETPASPP